MSLSNQMDSYKAWIHFIQEQNKNQRRVFNQRMISVFFWCFLAPVIVFVLMMILVQKGILPSGARGYLDWLILIFPVVYSLYFLGAEVLKDLPSFFKKGSLSSTLSTALNETKWREEVVVKAKKKIDVDFETWDWISENFKMDINAMRNRNRFLTALAGAVFFLILQGIDVLEPNAIEPLQVTPQSFFIVIYDAIGQVAKLISMIFVLVLLYLSGSQLVVTLERYGNCLELIKQGLKKRN